jgi:hypothetical protein
MLSNLLLSRLSSYVDAIIWDHQCGFDMTDELLISRFFPFIRYWRKNGSTMRQYISYSYTSWKPMVVQYSHSTTKLVTLIKMCLIETYSKVRIGKYLPDTFPIQNGLKQVDALPPLLFNFALEYVIRKIHENQVRLKFNGTHQLLVYVNDVNLLGHNI